MPTLLKIANDLAKTFVDANDKKYVAKHITNEINCLIYAATKRPVEYGVKILIIQVIYELINGKSQFQLEDDETILIEPEHISMFAEIGGKLLDKLRVEHEEEEKTASN